eukprot:Amastigsp_a177592_23.p2 type:complete len:103 gc:universal Amastigsp_a177592_23:697-389(-)
MPRMGSPQPGKVVLGRFEIPSPAEKSRISPFCEPTTYSPASVDAMHESSGLVLAENVKPCASTRCDEVADETRGSMRNSAFALSPTKVASAAARSNFVVGAM